PAYVPSYHIKAAAGDIVAYRLASKLADRLKRGPGDEGGGRARHETGDDFGRSSSHRCGDAAAELRVIIDFSGDQCRQTDGGIHPDEFRLKSFFLQEAPLLSHGESTV